MKRTIQLLLLFLVLTNSYGQSDHMDLKLKGFADTYHAIRSQDPYDFMSSRTRLRTEIEIDKEKSNLFASLNSMYNGLNNEETKIELREAFFQYSHKNWDFRAGRQIIIWGASDGLRITDLVSPMDMTEFLARDYDDIRIPVNALRLKYFNTKLSAEMIFIPVSDFYILPHSSKNPWSVFPTSGTPFYDLRLDNHPKKKLDNSEIGGRLSFFLSGIDMSLYALHTWNKMPVFEYANSANEDTVLVTGIYDRLDMLGLDVSLPVSQFVVRVEFSTFFNELQQTNSEFQTTNRNALNYLLGIDWYPGYDWTISAQYSGKNISDYIDIIQTEEITSLATLSISKKVLRNLLSLSTFMYYDLENRGLFNRSSADYSLSDEIHILVGYDWFEGTKGMFSYYKNNSEYWIKAKYSF